MSSSFMKRHLDAYYYRSIESKDYDGTSTLIRINGELQISPYLPTPVGGGTMDDANDREVKVVSRKSIAYAQNNPNITNLYLCEMGEENDIVIIPYLNELMDFDNRQWNTLIAKNCTLEVLELLIPKIIPKFKNISLSVYKNNEYENNFGKNIDGSSQYSMVSFWKSYHKDQLFKTIKHLEYNSFGISKSCRQYILEAIANPECILESISFKHVHDLFINHPKDAEKYPYKSAYHPSYDYCSQLSFPLLLAQTLTSDGACPNLKSITLDDCRLTDSQLYKMMSLLGPSTQLHHIDISRNLCWGDGIWAVSKFLLQEKNCQLTSLYINSDSSMHAAYTEHHDDQSDQEETNYPPTDLNLKALQTGLLQNSSLVELHLEYQRLTDNDIIKYLLPVIKVHAALQVLNLNKNVITAKGITAIVQGIIDTVQSKHHESQGNIFPLKKLLLDNNNISFNGWQEFLLLFEPTFMTSLQQLFKDGYIPLKMWNPKLQFYLDCNLSGMKHIQALCDIIQPHSMGIWSIILKNIHQKMQPHEKLAIFFRYSKEHTKYIKQRPQSVLYYILRNTSLLVMCLDHKRKSPDNEKKKRPRQQKRQDDEESKSNDTVNKRNKIII